MILSSSEDVFVQNSPFAEKLMGCAARRFLKKKSEKTFVAQLSQNGLWMFFGLWLIKT
jgi:hypothetical protein